jgi:hypothetical protein
VGSYQFVVTADDGVRLYIDNQLVLDKWVDQPPTTYTVTKDLTAGNHDIKVEYYEKAGGAIAKVSYNALAPYTASYWNLPGTGSAPVIPSTPPDVTRQETSIDYDWSGGSPVVGITADHFAVRWVRQANFMAGTYRFTTTSDDGIRVYVDGVVVIDQWNDHGATQYTTDVPVAGGTHEIKIEYYENAGGAVAKARYDKL